MAAIRPGLRARQHRGDPARCHRYVTLSVCDRQNVAIQACKFAATVGRSRSVARTPIQTRSMPDGGDPVRGSVAEPIRYGTFGARNASI